MMNVNDGLSMLNVAPLLNVDFDGTIRLIVAIYSLLFFFLLTHFYPGLFIYFVISISTCCLFLNFYLGSYIFAVVVVTIVVVVVVVVVLVAAACCYSCWVQS